LSNKEKLDSGTSALIEMLLPATEGSEAISYKIVEIAALRSQRRIATPFGLAMTSNYVTMEQNLKLGN